MSCLQYYEKGVNTRKPQQYVHSHSNKLQIDEKTTRKINNKNAVNVAKPIQSVHILLHYISSQQLLHLNVVHLSSGYQRNLFSYVLLLFAVSVQCSTANIWAANCLRLSKIIIRIIIIINAKKKQEHTQSTCTTLILCILRTSEESRCVTRYENNPR